MGGAPSQIFPIDSGLAHNVRENTSRLPGLWLGGQDVLEDPSFFMQNDIGWVLSLGPATPSTRIKLAGREQVNLPDVATSNLGVHFKKIVLFIAHGRHVLGHNVYVHCAAGISRSTTSVCAYLIAHLGLGFPDVLRFLSGRRKAVCPNEGFRQQLRTYEKSSLRKELAEEMRRQCQWYDELREADLDAVRRQLQAPASAADSPEDNARKAVQAQVAAARRSGKQASVKLGDGSTQGDYGLSWLMGDRTPRKSRDSSGPEKSGSRWSFKDALRR
jgi:hypothetical protein